MARPSKTQGVPPGHFGHNFRAVDAAFALLDRFTLGQVEESEETAALNQRECPLCGIKFVEFRNSGRLGCPHDYQEFREELQPLLENIHGDTRHCGKTPRRLPQSQQTQSELIQLRKQLHQAVTREAYEEAAQLRDKIRKLEEG